MNRPGWRYKTLQNSLRSSAATVALILIAVSIVAISSAQSKPAQRVLKIAVTADGRITVNGSPRTMNSLRASLTKLSEQKGVVWYYREAAEKTPPPEAKQVIQAVIEAGLPIRLSTRPDYSDAVGMDGKAIAAPAMAIHSPQPKRIPAAVAGGLLCGSAAPESTDTSLTDSRNRWSPPQGGSMCGEPIPPPLYPRAAKLAGIQGTVTLKAVIGKDGTVKSLVAVEGHPMLVPAAIEAVQRWKYRPYSENGKPVEVETTVAVNFTLQ